MERSSDSLNFAIGEKAPYFSLPGTDGKIYSNSDFSEAKALLIVFTANHCPYAQAYEKRIRDIAARYKDKGLSVVAICSNDGEAFPEDSFENMKTKSKAVGFPFPYLHDQEQIVAEAFDAACTPEVYLFDSERKLRYHGMIDDNYEHEELVEQHYLRDAIDALLHGEEPPFQLTPVIGCSIKWKN